MKRPVILVDAMNLAYRAHFSYGNLTTSEKKPVGVIFGFLVLLQDTQKLGPCDVVICWEGEQSNVKSKLWRLALHPKVYKEGREKNPHGPSIRKQAKELIPILKVLGYKQCCVSGLEADDVIGVLSKKLSKDPRVTKVYILSSDKDFFQLIDDKISVLRKEKTKLKEYTCKKVEKLFGVTAFEWARYKSFVGDSTDKYKGIPGVGPKTGIKIVKSGMIPKLPWKKQPKESRKEFMSLKKNWDQAMLCWKLSYIPRSSKYSLLPEESRISLRKQLKSLKQYRRVFSRSDYKKAIHTFGQICADLEFQSMLAERHRFFTNAVIKDD